MRNLGPESCALVQPRVQVGGRSRERQNMAASGLAVCHLAYGGVPKSHCLPVFDAFPAEDILTLPSGSSPSCHHSAVYLRCRLQHQRCQSLCCHRALWVIVLKLEEQLPWQRVFTRPSLWLDRLVWGQGPCVLACWHQHLSQLLVQSRSSESVHGIHGYHWS